MNVDLAKGNAVILLIAPSAGLLDRLILLVSLHEVAAEHNHACHPEKQNLVGGNQQSRRIKNSLIPRLLRPAQRSKWQEPGREPCIENVGNLLQLRAAALRAGQRSFPRHDYMLAIVTSP